MMIQHTKAMELAARLGDKVFGLLVSWRGETMTVTHFGSGDERWLVEGFADDGADGITCHADAPTPEAAMDEVAAQIQKFESPGGQPRLEDGPDEDPSMY